NRLGLDYRKNGRPGVASTAGGLVRTYDLQLNTVQVGDVVLHNVAGSITEGTGPSEILLGMSFLGQLDMKRVGDKMELFER
ncbi:MAG: retropepsin-like aspartic protease, partial [Pseudomonadota bacterium]